MRIAAGIILIILGALSVPGLLIILRGLVPSLIFSYIPIYAVPGILLGIVQAPLFITGGIFCLRRKYWRACLASASFAVLLGIYGLVGALLSRYTFESWSDWIIARVLALFLAEVIAVIFIMRTKKQWQEISGSADGEVSYDG
jgi:hypothetical protein